MLAMTVPNAAQAAVYARHLTPGWWIDDTAHVEAPTGPGTPQGPDRAAARWSKSSASRNLCQWDWHNRGTLDAAGGGLKGIKMMEGVIWARRSCTWSGRMRY